MFSLKRRTILEQSIWSPHHTDEDGRCLGYLEAWNLPADDPSANYRSDILRDNQVKDWLRRPPPPNAKGGIRLIICERFCYEPLEFPMSKDTFLAIEEEFQLPAATLATFHARLGRHYSHFNYPHDDDAEKARSFELVIKIPQMWRLSNSGLALSHCFRTGITTAFLYGGYLLYEGSIGGYSKTPQLLRIREQIESTISHWNHPLLLPRILMDMHMQDVNRFSTEVLWNNTKNIERTLGVTRIGEAFGHDRNLDSTLRRIIKDQKERMVLTALLNTTVTDVIVSKGVFRWDQRFLQIFASLCDEIQKHHLGTATVKQELRESMEYLASSTDSALERAELLKERLEVQLSILYNFVAQADNIVAQDNSSLNIRLAAVTGLDSAAMKTLALVTIIFLPPTFVATLFSMSIFDWQSDSSTSASNNSSVVGYRFWIYWAVSVPLTIVVLVSWRFWWRHQKWYYLNQFPSTIRSPENESVPSPPGLPSFRRRNTRPISPALGDVEAHLKLGSDLVDAPPSDGSRLAVADLIGVGDGGALPGHTPILEKFVHDPMPRWAWEQRVGHADTT